MPDPAPIAATKPPRKPAPGGGYFASKYFTPAFFPVAYFPAAGPATGKPKT